MRKKALRLDQKRERKVSSEYQKTGVCWKILKMFEKKINKGKLIVSGPWERSVRAYASVRRIVVPWDQKWDF